MKHISFLLLPILLLALMIPLGTRTAAQVSATATPTGADGSDCDHDGGNTPGDDICTPTPAPPTVSPTVCAPVTKMANFTLVAPGKSVEGLGAVAPHLNISSALTTNGVKNTAVSVAEHARPVVYGGFGPNGLNTVVNAGIDPVHGGFGDPTASDNLEAASYVFTFNVPIQDFRLRMLDYGDYNPKRGTSHAVVLNAYDATSSTPVFMQTLSYNTPAQNNPILGAPTWSDLYGNLQQSGDAVSAPAPAAGSHGMPGKWIWHATGSAIVRVTLVVSSGGQDPNFALDHLSFVTSASCGSPSATPTP